MGSSSYITDKNGEVIQHTEYIAFGEVLVDEHSTTNKMPYLFNGKELDFETGLYYYGARYYDPRTSIFLNVDPLVEKTGTPYAYVNNNPIRYIDPDGKAPQDIVFINTRGVEVHRIKSDTEHKTYIVKDGTAGDPSISRKGWVEVPMPKIIQNRGSETVSSTKYQENDHLIAARTGYFNQGKNAGILDLVTDGGHPIPREAIKKIPDLDPTLVKAITIQESHAGSKGISDIMQSNVPGDWSNMKSKYGLSKGVKTDKSTSLFAGIRLLATKGFKGGVTYDSKTGKSTYSFQGWSKAVDAYNGGGVQGYQDSVLKMQKDAKTPKPSDY